MGCVTFPDETPRAWTKQYQALAKLRAAGAPLDTALSLWHIEVTKTGPECYHAPDCAKLRAVWPDGVETTFISLSVLVEHMADGLRCPCQHGLWRSSPPGRLLGTIYNLPFDAPACLEELGWATSCWLGTLARGFLPGDYDACPELFAWVDNTLSEYPARLAAWAETWHDDAVGYVIRARRVERLRHRSLSLQDRVSLWRRQAAGALTQPLSSVSLIWEIAPWWRRARTRRFVEELNVALTRETDELWQTGMWLRVAPESSPRRSWMWDTKDLLLLACLPVFDLLPGLEPRFAVVPEPVSYLLREAPTYTWLAQTSPGDDLELAKTASVLHAAGMPALESLDAARLVARV